MEKIPDSFRDLLSTEFVTLATVGKWGGPHQSIVWFLAEGDDVKLSMNTSRLQTDNLARNPACSLLITDPKNSYRYLELRGKATMEPDPDYAFANKVGAKYGSDLHEHDQPGDKRVVVTIAVERARGWPESA
ncbi:MAG TPA: PPOX class F420-dependent oxidoreductase [Acidimicrobiales bacterium]|jgi:PPOX class probable F420-dependent enzyme|nr:PPOX class F420-dependent oxidoreductase [Acidimicrobiales bacterium]